MQTCDPSTLPEDPVGRTPIQFRFVRPLVADLDALVRGAGTPDMATVSRPGLDLLRLQRRFRGRVLLLSDSAPEDALWAAAVLGFPNAVTMLGRDEGPAAKAALAASHFPDRGFDFFGGPDSVAEVGAQARRLWLLGRDPDLQRQMLTAGTRLLQLSARDRLPLRVLRPARGQGWPDHPYRLAPGATGRRLEDAAHPASGTS